MNRLINIGADPMCASCGDLYEQTENDDNLCSHCRPSEATVENARADYLSIFRWTQEMAEGRRGISTAAEVAKLNGKLDRLRDLVGADRLTDVIEGR